MNNENNFERHVKQISTLKISRPAFNSLDDGNDGIHGIWS